MTSTLCKLHNISSIEFPNSSSLSITYSLPSLPTNIESHPKTSFSSSSSPLSSSPSSGSSLPSVFILSLEIGDSLLHGFLDKDHSQVPIQDLIDFANRRGKGKNSIQWNWCLDQALSSLVVNVGRRVECFWKRHLELQNISQR